jgi:hypothetical protein
MSGVVAKELIYRCWKRRNPPWHWTCERPTIRAFNHLPKKFRFRGPPAALRDCVHALCQENLAEVQRFRDVGALYDEEHAEFDLEAMQSGKMVSLSPAVVAAILTGKVRLTFPEDVVLEIKGSGTQDGKKRKERHRIRMVHGEIAKALAMDEQEAVGFMQQLADQAPYVRDDGLTRMVDEDKAEISAIREEATESGLLRRYQQVKKGGQVWYSRDTVLLGTVVYQHTANSLAGPWKRVYTTDNTRLLKAAQELDEPQ